ETMTDNKKRTVAEIRNIFSKLGGNLGENGCVAWMFSKVGLILVPVENTDEDKLIEVALESGADDVKQDGDFYEVYTQMNNLFDVREKLMEAGITVESAEISAVPQSTVTVTGKDAQKLLKLLSTLEDHDDVQKVYSNMDIPDEEMENME
ncbi:YebC/PmpR family DNA-binding transcriptional regulator, partial [bacterium]